VTITHPTHLKRVATLSWGLVSSAFGYYDLRCSEIFWFFHCI